MADRRRKPVNQGMDLLRKDIQEGTFRRVYLLYGEESYLVQQFRQRLVGAAVDPEDTMNLNIHREGKPDWGMLQDEILAMPFFSDRRVIVLEDTRLFMSRSVRKKDSGETEETNMQEDASLQEEDEGGSADGAGMAQAEDAPGGAEDLGALFAAFIPRIPETSVVIFVEQPDDVKAGGRKGRVSVDKRGRLYKAVAKHGLAVEFAPQDESVLRTWVLGMLGEEKIRITGGALDLFLQMTGCDMSRIHTETEKLISYAGSGGEIRTRDVQALTSEVLEGKVFRMIDLITRRDLRGALDLYDDLLRLREPPVMILVLLMRQFNRIMVAKDILQHGGGTPQLMEELKLTDWQARQLVSQARPYTRSAARRIVEECVRTQHLAQSGRIDMNLGLELLIVKCCTEGS